MRETHLTGLEGTNPLGFLAALGVQVAFFSKSRQPRIWWSDHVTPHAIVNGDFTVDRIVDRALEAFAEWSESSAVNPRRPDGSAMPKADEIKLAPPDIREYLGQCRQGGSSAALGATLVAEGSLDNQGVAKPSDLYFTAGQQKFLDMVRKILRGASRKDILVGIEGPWSYESELPSLMWDVGDDRIYALAADNPAKEKKLTNPGAEALALLGLSLHPVFAGRGQTITQGCSGEWKTGHYSWPLWHKPASLHAVRSLLAHAYYHPTAMDRVPWFRAWGVSNIMRSPIRRSREGGYGTFGPSEIVWRR